MPEDNEIHGRGGKRPGAGRPRTYSKLIAFRASKEIAAYIEMHPNKSKFIEHCIKHYMDEEKAGNMHL